MHTSKFRFTLDLQTTQSQVSIPITLGDTGRTWYISFSDGSLPFALADGCLAKLEIKRPTGTFLEEFCPIENGTTVKYAFSQNENTAAVEGLHECAVILYNTEGEMIGSPRFTMIVIDRVISSDDLNLSDENRTAIDAIIAAEASRQDAETGRVNAEAERQNAEINRERNAAQIKTLIEETRFLPKIEEADNGKIVGVQAGMYVLLSGNTGGSIGAKIALSIDPETYELTATLLDDKENEISGDSVSLPLTSMVVGAEETDGVLTLTLQNGNTVSFDIGALVDGLVSKQTHEQAVATLNAKINALILSGTGVKANPEEEATESLTKIMIGGTVYALPVGGAAVAEYGGDTVIGTGNVGPIISGVSYGATEGMTWEVWLASEHNVLGLSAADPYVVSSDGRILVYALTQNPAALSDAVVIGGLYELAAPAEQTNGGGEA